MKRLSLLAILMVTVGADTAVPQTEADEAAIKESFRTFEKAFAIADVEGMLAGIDERAVFAWGQLEVIGRDAIRQQFLKKVESGWKGGRATHRFSGIEFLSPTIAIAWGTYDVAGPDGVSEAGHFTNTMIKKGEKWLTAAEQNCAKPLLD